MCAESSKAAVAKRIIDRWRERRIRTGNLLWTFRAWRRARAAGCPVPEWVLEDIDRIASALDRQSVIRAGQSLPRKHLVRFYDRNDIADADRHWRDALIAAFGFRDKKRGGGPFERAAKDENLEDAVEKIGRYVQAGESKKVATARVERETDFSYRRLRTAAAVIPNPRKKIR